MSNRIHIVLSSEVVTASSVTVYCKKHKDGALKWILPLLWYIAINKMFCHLLLEWDQGYVFYILCGMITSISLLCITWSQFSDRARLLILNGCTSIRLIAFTYLGLTNNPFKEWPKTDFFTSSILSRISLLLYFIEQLKSDQKIRTRLNISIWICSCFLIVYLFYLILFLVREMSTWTMITTFDSLYTLQFVLVALLYSTLAFGFYSEKKQPFQTTAYV